MSHTHVDDCVSKRHEIKAHSQPGFSAHIWGRWIWKGWGNPKVFVFLCVWRERVCTRVREGAREREGAVSRACLSVMYNLSFLIILTSVSYLSSSYCHVYTCVHTYIDHVQSVFYRIVIRRKDGWHLVTWMMYMYCICICMNAMHTHIQRVCMCGCIRVCVSMAVSCVGVCLHVCKCVSVCVCVCVCVRAWQTKLCRKDQDLHTMNI